MNLVNRSVLIVKPKQPLVDWLNSLDEPPLTLEECQQDPTAYLIPEVELEGDKQNYLKEHFSEIFEQELASWSRDEETWPKNRNLKTFRQWFDVSFHTMTIDLDPAPIERDEFDPLLGLDIGDLFTQGYSDEELEKIKNKVSEWHDEFSKSDSYQRLSEEQKQLSEDIVLMFAEFMYSYLGLSPERWEVEQLKECCLDIFPRKVTADESYFGAIAPILSAFLSFLEAENIMAYGSELAESVEEIEQEIVDRALNPENWGLAKTFVIRAKEAGVDVSNEEELQQFMGLYNRQIERLTRGKADRPKAGRNDPCPCGSGKKYKNCCGQ